MGALITSFVLTCVEEVASPTHLEFSKDRLVSLNSASGVACVWDLDKRALLHRLAHGQQEGPVSLACDLDKVATLTAGSIKIWDTDAGSCEKHVGIDLDTGKVSVVRAALSFPFIAFATRTLSEERGNYYRLLLIHCERSRLLHRIPLKDPPTALTKDSFGIHMHVIDKDAEEDISVRFDFRGKDP